MKECKLKINNKDYTLTMTRDSIKWLEAYGFSIENFEMKPVTYYDLLWNSLFIAKHPEVNPSLAFKLQESYSKEKGNKMLVKVIRFAIEEYKTFMNALADIDSTENDEELEIIEV